MDRNGVLSIVRGARDVAKARGNSNIRSKTSGTRQNNARRSCRMRGQVGVAVRRGDNNGPLAAFDSKYGRHHPHELETADSGEDTLGPRTDSTQQAGTQPPLDTADYGTVDLTRDSPETTGGARHSRVADVDSSSDGGRSAQSLGAWLQPAPPSKAAAAKGSSRRRKRPLQDTAGRTWAATTSSQRQDGSGMPGAGGRGAGGDGSLAAWLEPRQPAASRERRRNTPSRRSGTFDTGGVGHGCSGHSDSDDDDGDDDGRWMSERLDGRDPNGAARAKDSWTDRERRNLTSTDVALGAKRKGRRGGGGGGGGGRRGWKTKAGGSKVFGPSGQAAAFGLFEGGGGGGGGFGRKKRKR